MIRKRGTLSNMVRVFIQDNSITTGKGKTGLAFDSTNLQITVIREKSATPTLYTGANIETITTIGTFQAPSTSAKCRFKAIDGTNRPGEYEIHFHDDAGHFAVGDSSKNVQIRVDEITTTALNIAPCLREIDLVAYDEQDATALGTGLALEAGGNLKNILGTDGLVKISTDAQDLSESLDVNVKTKSAALGLTTQEKADVNAEVVDALSIAPSKYAAVWSIGTVKGFLIITNTGLETIYCAIQRVVDDYQMEWLDGDGSFYDGVEVLYGLMAEDAHLPGLYKRSIDPTGEGAIWDDGKYIETFYYKIGDDYYPLGMRNFIMVDNQVVNDERLDYLDAPVSNIPTNPLLDNDERLPEEGIIATEDDIPTMVDISDLATELNATANKEAVILAIPMPPTVEQIEAEIAAQHGSGQYDAVTSTEGLATEANVNTVKAFVDTEVQSILDVVTSVTYGLNALLTAIGTRLATSDYTAPDNASITSIKDSVEHVTYGLNALLTAINTRMATFTYTAPDNASITTIKSVVENVTYGLSALKILIDAISTKTGNLPEDPADASVIAGLISTVNAYVDEVESLLKNVTYGLEALKTAIGTGGITLGEIEASAVLAKESTSQEIKEQTDKLHFIGGVGEEQVNASVDMVGANRVVTAHLRKTATVTPISEVSVQAIDENEIIATQGVAPTDGDLVLNMRDGVYELRCFKTGYTFEVYDLTVNGDEEITIYGDEIEIGVPLSADSCRVYEYLFNPDDDTVPAVADVTATATISKLPYDYNGKLHSGVAIDCSFHANYLVKGAEGYGEIYWDLVKGAKVEFSITSFLKTTGKKITIPNQSSARLIDI